MLQIPSTSKQSSLPHPHPHHPFYFQDTVLDTTRLTGDHSPSGNDSLGNQVLYGAGHHSPSGNGYWISLGKASYPLCSTSCLLPTAMPVPMHRLEGLAVQLAVPMPVKRFPTAEVPDDQGAPIDNLQDWPPIEILDEQKTPAIQPPDRLTCSGQADVHWKALNWISTGTRTIREPFSALLPIYR